MSDHIKSSAHRITERPLFCCPLFLQMSSLEILPLEVIDKTVGQSVWIVLQSNREFIGTLIGFDDFVNVIVEDAKEIIINADLQSEPVMQHKGRMLLSGNSIAMLAPGTRAP